MTLTGRPDIHPPPSSSTGGPVRDTAIVRRSIEEREESLSPYAVKSRESRGRQVADAPCPFRTAFQRDRDRIIHCKAFRRLKHKTQVFIAPLGDHYVTRLTHTLEVAQIARTIARALNLNEDLTEAIALGHDIGHTPFGHIGEDELGRLAHGGFRHSQQSLRIVDHLEKDGRGLNLTWEVRQGIVSHSKPRGDFLDGGVAEQLSLEAQVCRLADAVAYLNHDLADSFRAQVLNEADLPAEVAEVLGRRHSQRIATMVGDVVQSSWRCTGDGGGPALDAPSISMSAEVRSAVNVLREFLFERVYIPEGLSAEGQAAHQVVRLLYGHFIENAERLPIEHRQPGGSEDRAVVDYVAGMTDHYALRLGEEIRPGVARIFSTRLT